MAERKVTTLGILKAKPAKVKAKSTTTAKAAKPKAHTKPASNVAPKNRLLHALPAKVKLLFLA